MAVSAWAVHGRAATVARPASHINPSSSMLNTETPSSRHPDLDLYALPELIDAFIEDQLAAVNAVRAAGPQLVAAVAAALHHHPQYFCERL